jgi:hypothetical protein
MATVAANAADQMYVALSNSGGLPAAVYHDYPNATQVGEWTKWDIELQEFADKDIDLNNVDKFYIGIGDKSNFQAGGSGMMLFDDVRLYSLPVPSIGLVAHYPLDEVSGTTVPDASGNGYDGTAVGNPVYVEGPSGLGTALEFDGTGSQYVDLGTFNPSETTGQLSVSLWAKWNGLTSFWQGLIGKRDTWAADEMMWQIEANQTEGTLGFFREGSSPSDGDPVLPIGEWAHVAATFDGTTAKFYFNGQMTGQGAFSFGSDRDAALQFGACQANGDNPFNGALDEVRIYDTVLSDAEVLELAGK